jgi:hypothetical protein
MAILLVAVLVNILPWYEEQAAQAAPSRAKVFLAESRDVRVQRDCAAAVATALTSSLAGSKHAVPARSAGDADVVVQLKECRTTTVPRLGGEIQVTTSLAGRDRVVQTGASIGGQLTTAARVLLVVDDHGKTKEFAPDEIDLPLPEAASNATEALLAWVKTARSH